MTRLMLVLILCVSFTSPVEAGDRKLRSIEILDLLAGQKVKYDSAIKDGQQQFHPDGTMWFKSYYKEMTGWWKVENDQFCQSNNNRLSWRCYDLVMDGDVPTFVSRTNSRFPILIYRKQ